VDEALKLAEESLALSRKLFSPEDRQTFSATHNLALSYDRIGRGDEARRMWEELVTLSRKVNGPEHPRTLTLMHNLTASCFSAGHRDQAVDLQEEILKLSRKVNGPDHPDTLAATNNLAIYYSAAGRRNEALQLREELLALERRLLGSEHRSTLGSMTNLAISYGIAGRLSEGIALQEVSLSIKRRVLPPNDPFMAVALQNMAELYKRAGLNEQASQIRDEFAALSAGIDLPAGKPGVSGPANSSVGVAAPNSAPGVPDLKQLEEALETTRKAKGAEHADSIAGMTVLAAAYGADGSGRKAIRLGEEALALARRVLPAGDPCTVEAMNVMVDLYNSVDLTGEAAELIAELEALKTEK
jgi:hypothetical protein